MYNQYSESFWFSTVSSTDDPGLSISTSIGTPASVRNTWLGIEEDSGNLVVQAYQTEADGSFTDNPTATSPALIWGAWYQVKVTADFINGPDNDQVNYEVLDASGNVLMKTTIGSWETFYAAGGAEDSPGPVPSTRVTFALGGDSNDKGIYIDNFSESVATVATPEPSTWALMLGGVAMLAFWRKARSRRVS